MELRLILSQALYKQKCSVRGRFECPKKGLFRLDIWNSIACDMFYSSYQREVWYGKGRDGTYTKNFSIFPVSPFFLPLSVILEIVFSL